MPIPRKLSSRDVRLRAASSSKCRHQVRLGERGGDVELPPEADTLGDLLEQLLQRGDADRLQHRVAVGVGQRR